MLVGTIRSLETSVITHEAPTLPASVAEAAALIPAGWESTRSTVHQVKETGLYLSTVNIVKYGELRTVEGEDLDAIRAATPEGHQILHVVTA